MTVALSVSVAGASLEMPPASVPVGPLAVFSVTMVFVIAMVPPVPWLEMPPTAGPAPLGALKAAINGVPSLTIEPSAHDAAGARDFYRRLEEDIVPAFYRRDRAGIPIDWVGRVRQTMRDGVPRFSARRGVKATTERLYNPALRNV